MEEKRFRKNDEGFRCLHCGAEIPPNGATSRDHCPKCLYSVHIDIFPGDRKNRCGGELIPEQALPDARKGFVILYRCKKCGKTLRNKAALSGQMPDDTQLLITLTAPQA